MNGVDHVVDVGRIIFGIIRAGFANVYNFCQLTTDCRFSSDGGLSLGGTGRLSRGSFVGAVVVASLLEWDLNAYRSVFLLSGSGSLEAFCALEELLFSNAGSYLGTDLAVFVGDLRTYLAVVVGEF